MLTHPATDSTPSPHAAAPGGTPPSPSPASWTAEPARPRRRGPGWGGVLGSAVLAAVLAAGGTAAVLTAVDDPADAASSVAVTTPAAATGSAFGSGTGSTASVPLTGAVDWNTVADAVRPSVVTIQVSSGAGGPAGSAGGEGTGVVLDAEGHVLTNAHVATAAGAGADIRVALSDGRLYGATTVGTDASTDLAVLSITGAPDDLVPAAFGSSDAVEVGQQVMAVGNPLGLSDTVTTGIISATDRPVTTSDSGSGAQRVPGTSGQGSEPVVTNALQTDAAINPGNSGGPLVDAAGTVIGINSSIASSTGASVGLGFAIPGDEAQRIASELVTDGTAAHAQLGVGLQDGTATADGQARQSADVATVVAGSPAAGAGLAAGDQVTAVDGEAVAGAESLTAQVREHAPGDEVELTVVRDGAVIQVAVVLGQREE